MHPSHEARMNIAGRVGNDELGELPIDISELGSLTRKLGAKPRPNLIRYRLPDRAIANVGDVVDHVIEHAMTLCANRVPILRVEGVARLRVQERFAHPSCPASCLLS